MVLLHDVGVVEVRGRDGGEFREQDRAYREVGGEEAAEVVFAAERPDALDLLRREPGRADDGPRAERQRVREHVQRGLSEAEVHDGVRRMRGQRLTDAGVVGDVYGQ